ncbi:hypothetical protein J437_LFUL006620 [Ladona fulva]|uniref:Uncharacterized protein n=1 Tax=Ladona fulva TaxID=123851 RepID=A0A8K0KI72_LADFU|nr:hypothetical protein J437_LFUL006620 [Ladona fulva]
MWDVKVFRGANCGSDLFLLKSVIREHISIAQKQNGRRRYHKRNTDKLKNPVVWEANQISIAQKLGSMDEDVSIMDQKWTCMKESFIYATREVHAGVGEKKSSKK